VKPAKAPNGSAKPPKVVSAPAKPVSLPDGYFVQLGVFDDTDNAGRVFDNAVALGLPAYVQSRVMVGPFRNKREAEAARDRLKNIAEGVVLPPQNTAKADETPKAKSRRRAK
jgi:cell division septation protein DedD